jgi:uncharacterized protein
MTTSLRTSEASRARSKPRYFYHFFRGTQDWFYTNYRLPQGYAGDYYTPLEINHSSIERGGEDRPGAVSVTLPTDSDLGLVLQAGSSPTPIQLKIYMYSVTAVDDARIIFQGDLRGAEVTGELMTVQAVPLQAQLSVDMPRGRFQRWRCRWTTYDPDTCKVNPASFTHVGTVTAIDGLTVTVSGTATSSGDDPVFFKLGVMTKGEYKGMIEDQDGDNLTLQFMIPGLAIGNSVSVLAGDDRTRETCKNKFNNIARYFGFGEMPTSNPHYGQGLRN